MPHLTGEAPPPLYHPYGQLSRLWERAVLVGLWATLWPALSVARRAVDSGSLPSDTDAWWVCYVGVQVASKIPISFTYSARGAHAILDLSGFGVLLLASVAFALGWADLLPKALWQVGFGVVAASMLVYFATPAAVDPNEAPIPAWQYVFGKSMSVFASSPMILALWVLALDR